MIYLTPRGLIPDIGGIVVDKYNKVQWVVNHELYADMGDMGKYGDILVSPPDFSQFAPVSIKPFTSIVYGLGQMPIKDLVLFTQRTFFRSKQRLKWMADNVPGFPVTSKQIEKHWQKDVCYIRGYMKRRKVDSSQFISRDDIPDDDESDDEDPKPSAAESSLPVSKVEPRNEIVGYQVGSDVYGPFYGEYIISYVDKSTGYPMAFRLGKGGKANVPQSFEQMLETYRSYGHHSDKTNRPIASFISDSDTVYTSQVMTNMYRRAGIKHTTSPPGSQAYNGLAENNHHRTSCIVTCMYVCSPHVSYALWTRAWHLANIIDSLGPSRRAGAPAGKTKYEDFYGEKPDLKSLIILPFGLPVEMRLTVKKGQFTTKAHTCIYVGPSERIKGGICGFSYTTKMYYHSDKYEIWTEVPSHLPLYKPKFFGLKEEIFPVVLVLGLELVLLLKLNY